MDNLRLLELGMAAGALLSLIGVVVWCGKAVGKVLHYLQKLRGAVQPLQEMRGAIQVMLRHSIARAHSDYAKQQIILPYTLDCLMEMYDRYAALSEGGDGVIGGMIEELKRLPINNG
jgi:hypothetical protein